ncbi:MAG: quinone oxidoreductase [Rhodospirillales bacterium]|nr:quinone oxidoreductase [Rhodospirillales bacterium]
MPKAIQIDKPGPASAMKWREVTVGKPKKGEVRLRQTAVGLNYIDVYHRMGMYPMPMPLIIGMEGAGVVEALGAGVTDLKLGDRVAYAATPLGAYAEERLMPAASLVKVPKAIDDQTAATMMLQGMTVHYLLHSTYKVQKGDTILIHAAAGGIGLIMCQWAKHLGATVIGTVGSKKKGDLARDHGCDHVIDYSKQNFVDRVKKITKGAGVPVVYDSVGKDTFYGSLDCLRPRGVMALFGNASGPVTNIDPNILAGKGSLFLTRPSLPNYVATREELTKRARELFRVVANGTVKIEVNQTYALKDAAQAHRDLEARKTTGSTVLIP